MIERYHYSVGCDAPQTRLSLWQLVLLWPAVDGWGRNAKSIAAVETDKSDVDLFRPQSNIWRELAKLLFPTHEFHTQRSAKTCHSLFVAPVISFSHHVCLQTVQTCLSSPLTTTHIRISTAISTCKFVTESMEEVICRCGWQGIHCPRCFK